MLGRAPGPVEEAVNALSWAHQLAVVEDQTEHSLVRQVLAAAKPKRILAHKTIKKEPITAEILQKLHDKFISVDADLATIRTMAICLHAWVRRVFSDSAN